MSVKLFMRLKLALLLFILVALLQVSASSASDELDLRPFIKPGLHTAVQSIGGYVRQVVIYSPGLIKKGELLPVVFVLHGAGGNGTEAIRRYGWEQEAVTGHFFVVALQGLPVRPSEPSSFLVNPNIWRDHRPGLANNQVDDMAYFETVLNEIEQGLPVDPKRVYVTGFSNGAGMTFLLGAAYADRIAAIAPLSSHNPQTAILPSRPMNLLYMTGTEDPLNPIAGGEVKLPWGNISQRAPLQESINTWLEWDGCSREGTVLSDLDGVKKVMYGPGRDNVEVIVYTIDGMGHHWPGSREALPQSIVGPSRDPIRATDVIWDFFTYHPMGAPVSH